MKKIWLFLIWTLALVGLSFASGSSSLTATVDSVDKLPANCLMAKDECNNSCTRVNGTWACTLMACDVKQPVRCTQLAVDVQVTIEPAVCTADYNPVCAKVEVQCITAPCDPVRETFSNRCMALNNPLVKEVKAGACENGWVGVIVGGDRDEHGCIGSAGYVWDENAKACVRPREAEALLKLQAAHEFAFEYGITSMDTLVSFRADDYISRQEAAKMIVGFAKAKLDANSMGSLMNANASCAFSDKAQFGSTLSAFVTQSCQYGFMRGDVKNGKAWFNPQGNLTKAQALAVLIRIVDKRADETMNLWYQGYITKATELGLDLSSATDRDAPITRGELIIWMEALFETNS